MLANALPYDLPSFASFPFCATYNTLDAKFEVIALNSAILGCIAAIALAFVKYKLLPSARLLVVKLLIVVTVFATFAVCANIAVLAEFALAIVKLAPSIALITRAFVKYN
jgi:hypothetical protein